MHFVVKGNIYHQQTPACQNIFPLKQKRALKNERKSMWNSKMKLSAFQIQYHQPGAWCQDNAVAL